VFEVIDTENQHFALKLLGPKTPQNKLRRFRNEIQFCSRAVSRHIVQVLDYGKSEHGSFYIMPLYPSTLRERLNKGIARSEVLPIFSQILDGVEAAHLLDVCHRDLKPENVLCAPAENLFVLADFGIAQFRQEDLVTAVETGEHERLANFAYAAPEQRIRGGKVNERADIFALGLILNEMFTGELPHGTGFQEIGTVAPEFGYLDELVESMLRQDANLRPASVRQIKELLIARGHQFVSLQHLAALKKGVVPESQVEDNLIADPIRVTEVLDYADSVLTVKLNQPINPKWESCFRLRATAYSANFSAGMISFRGERAFLRVDEHFSEYAFGYLKQYLSPANETYAEQIRREHQEQIALQRGELRAQIAKQEQKARVLGKLQT
jgi:serine/threonine protein kinase